MLLEKLLREILAESVSVNSVNDAIDRHIRVIINYHTNGEDNNTGARVIEVYAYGLTKAGNPVIRAFQPYGDTTSRVPSWKFFRLDRISAWKPTGQVFDHPADFYYKNLGNFNPNGDETMSVVYKIAKFGDGEQEIPITPNVTSPKLKQTQQKVQPKQGSIYKTDTEIRMDRLRNQLNNPIKLSDIKTKNGFINYGNKTASTDTQTMSGPKLKPNANNDEVEKISNTMPNAQDNTQQQPQTTQDTSTQDKKKDDLFRTDTEISLEKLMNQLKNPKKIDLTKIPKK